MIESLGNFDHMLSLGPSPAVDGPALRRPQPTRRTRWPATQLSPAEYIAPLPIRSSSPTSWLPSSNKKSRPGANDPRQRQASEEISQILRNRSKDNLAISTELFPDPGCLDGSRSADMFVKRTQVLSNRVAHFATPPASLAEADESEEDSVVSSDDSVTPGFEDEPTDFSDLHGLRYALSQSPSNGHLRSASIYDLPVMAASTFTPPLRSQNPLPRNSPFVLPTADYRREGAEIGLLSFSPPPFADEDIMARRAKFTTNANLASDFRNKIRFGDLTRGVPSSAQ